jgi:gamma-glutamyl phosphate reductase
LQKIKSKNININNKKAHILDKSNKDIKTMKEMNYTNKKIDQLLISTKECMIIIVKIIHNIQKVPFK